MLTTRRPDNPQTDQRPQFYNVSGPRYLILYNPKDGGVWHNYSLNLSIQAFFLVETFQIYFSGHGRHLRLHPYVHCGP